MAKARINGIDIAYRLDGPADGEVVVLSNSLASTHAMWDGQARTLAAAGYRVLRYDSRGHGASDVPAGDYALATLADDVVALMDAVGVDRAHFCGLSKGGMVGQWLGAHHAGRLRALVLCDTAAHMPPADMWDQRIAMAREGGMAAVVDATIERWFTAEGRARLPDDVAAVREMILGTPVDGFCGCCAAIREMDQREAIGSISAPTLVVVGEADPSTPVSAAEAIVERVPGARLEIIEHAAHMSNLEQQARFDEALVGFLAEHRGR